MQLIFVLIVNYIHLCFKDYESTLLAEIKPLLMTTKRGNIIADIINPT